MAKGSEEKFCLRWNEFEANISTAFKELKDDAEFFDVTLACDDNQIRAHKVILSACSPFFKSVLKRNPHQHPLLYLKGVRFEDINSVLNFMYNGEVNVAQEELNSFLSVAEDLQVKGLTQSKSSNPPAKQAAPPPAARQQTNLPSIAPATHSRVKSSSSSSQQQAVGGYQAVVKTEHSEPGDCDVVLDTTDQMVDNSDYSAEQDGYQYEHNYGVEHDIYEEEVHLNDQNAYNNAWNTSEWKEKKMFSCEICFKNFSSKNSLLNHARVHKGLTTCTHCQKVFGTTSSLNFHIKNAHSNVY